ncbi:hypothetical protein IIA95_01700 [Patescibacteria group bacterium]|nr:hypothetical protein [Patescibacteria group bacterium]
MEGKGVYEKTCHRCGKPLQNPGVDSKKKQEIVVSACGKDFHEQCAACSKCHEVMANGELRRALRMQKENPGKPFQHDSSDCPKKKQAA